MKTMNNSGKALIKSKYNELLQGGIGSRMAASDKINLYKDVLVMYAKDMHIDFDSSDMAEIF